MKKTILALAVASFVLPTVSAHAGGWGQSGGLINISPNVDVGNIAALNDLLNGNAVGNGNGILSGILNGNKTGILSGNSYKVGRH